jgi:hypothetical protein
VADEAVTTIAIGGIIAMAAVAMVVVAVVQPPLPPQLL